MATGAATPKGSKEPTMTPTPLPTTGAERRWFHRVDAVPAVGQRIVFCRERGDDRRGVVIQPTILDTFRAGVGDEVRIRPDETAAEEAARIRQGIG
jgi:hypothetical protein